MKGPAEIFLKNLDLARQTLNFDLWAYVVMPEHVHVVLQPLDEQYEMAAILRAIKKPVSHEIFENFPSLRDRCIVNRIEGKTPEYRFWQAGGGYDRNIETAEDAWSKIHYVHWNPVKRDLCESQIEWPFSSARAYAEVVGNTPIPVDLCRWGMD